MKFSVIIPNYNGFELIKKNLPKVIESLSKFDAEIIIVDDASKQKEYQELKNFVSELDKRERITIKLIRNEKNLGFSSAVNKGTLESEGEFLVLLNTDVVPEKDFLNPIIADFEADEKLFGIGCMDKSIEGGKIVYRGRGEAAWERGFLVHRKGEVDKSDTFWISGGSSIIRKKFFEELERFDPLYNPFYWEDIDLSYRANKSGYNLLFEKRSVVEHKHSEGAIKQYYSDFKIRTIAYKNQFIFVWKNISDQNFILSHIFWLPCHLFSAIIRLDIAFFLGFILAGLSLPAIIGKRFRQKKLYKKKDSEIIAIS
ncbi:MAG: glycosyl transferase family protein [uncultured bacterium]|nr:MAG: glycosyl transferase family protein [uncultured bacterium]KKQ96826.1 MAG: Glycosyl transferase, group 2 family protein [Candidatus Levybacteria bacterium GW2011_GWA1_39_11]OGH36274.1 MAG: hypothetical protein A3B43_02555 [Candidatus Levybacteria bacterium RIFCSPLOWO2_01_FULL_38_120]